MEASRQARRRAWDVLQDLRAVLTKLGNVTIEVPSRKTFEAEGAILKKAFFLSGTTPFLHPYLNMRMYFIVLRKGIFLGSAQETEIYVY
jgi:hypothetical protein